MHSLISFPIASVFGTGEVVLLFLVVMLIFGGNRLPGLARGLGQSLREFKKASEEDDETDKAEAARKTDSTK